MPEKGSTYTPAPDSGSRHIKPISIDSRKWVSNWSLDPVVMVRGIRRHTPVSDERSASAGLAPPALAQPARRRIAGVSVFSNASRAA
jgi:hypothetical protein